MVAGGMIMEWLDFGVDKMLMAGLAIVAGLGFMWLFMSGKTID
jgi:hypothetical protein